MPEVDEYKAWLASGVSNREVIETFEITHPAWEPLYLANSDRGIGAILEDGREVRFIASRFYMEPPETTDTTNQGTTVALSALEGRIYDTVQAMTFDQRDVPIKATYRMFFLDDRSEPLLTPPPVWYIHSMEATREAVRIELNATELRMQRIGLYYTAQEFPALVYL